MAKQTSAIIKVKLIVDIVLRYICAGKRIVIPELGAFLVKQPTGEVIFSEFLKQDDGVLLCELTHEGMKPLEAAGAINRFVFEARHALRSGSDYPLEGIGTLRINSVTSKIIFIPIGAEPPAAPTTKPTRNLFTPTPKPNRKKVASPLQSSPVEEGSAVEESKVVDDKQESKGSGEAINLVESGVEVVNGAEDSKDSKDSSENGSKTEDPKSEGDSRKGGKQAKRRSDKIVVGREFSGRFCDDELSNEPLRYSRERRHRGYSRYNPRAKRVDYVMIIAIVVLLLAIGAIAYGVYISSQMGDGNPIVNIWESTVGFFSNLF